MRKRVILAFMLVFALLVTSGCGLIVKDEAVDRATPVIEVAGKTFTKGEILDQVSYSLDYQAYMYSMYGMAFDAKDATIIANTQTQVLDSLVEQAVLEQKQDEMGMSSFTPEELTQLETKVDESYKANLDSVKTSYFAETELTGEALDQAVEAKMAELGYSDKAAMLESEKTNAAYEKLKTSVVKDVQVTEEEIQAKYDENVASAKATYESDLNAYGTAAGQGTVYYRPAGYRYVKNLLRKFSEEDNKTIADLNTQLTDKQGQLTTVNTSIGELDVDTSKDTPEQAEARKELQSTQAMLTSEIGALETQLANAKEAAYAKVQPAIDEVLQKLADGGDFDALMAEYGEDDGMKASPAKETGYLVCQGYTQYVTEFTEASMALGKVGDVSPAVRTSFGIHLIQYASDLQEGEVPLAEVKDALSQELLTAKQDEFFATTLDTWVKDAGAKVYPERLK